MRNVMGKKVLLELLNENTSILLDFLKCTEAKKFKGISKDEVSFGEVELIEYLSDVNYNFKFNVQCNKCGGQDQVYVSVVSSDALIDKNIVNPSLKSAFNIVDHHQWNDWTGNEEGIKIRNLWCAIHMFSHSNPEENSGIFSSAEGLLLENLLSFSLAQQWSGDVKLPTEMQEIYYVVFLLINSKEDYEECKKIIESYKLG